VHRRTPDDSETLPPLAGKFDLTAPGDLDFVIRRRLRHRVEAATDWGIHRNARIFAGNIGRAGRIPSGIHFAL
jgi:hypothetical protein